MPLSLFDRLRSRLRPVTTPTLRGGDRGGLCNANDARSRLRALSDLALAAERGTPIRAVTAETGSWYQFVFVDGVAVDINIEDAPATFCATFVPGASRLVTVDGDGPGRAVLRILDRPDGTVTSYRTSKYRRSAER